VEFRLARDRSARRSPYLRQFMPHRSRLERSARAIAHLGAALCALLLLVAVGQPIFTDDAWWHLALGAAYAENGPWLARDPLLYTATGPPPPVSWLADLVLHGVARTGGFQALRVAQVAAVAGLLALVWRAARDASGSARAASLAAALFGAISAYRLVQLRPELFTIAGGLLLHRALLASPEPPPWRRVAATAAGIGLWANLHPAFALGPILLVAACAGLLAAAPLRRSGDRAADRQRALRLAAAAGLGVAASGAHPLGYGALGVALSASSSMLGSQLVLDEWRPFEFFAWPVPNLPPSALGFAAVWGIALAFVWAALRALRVWRSDERSRAADPALLGVALASFAAMSRASRFIWLAVFPLLFVLRSARAAPGGRAPGGALGAAPAALAALALAPAFLRFGDWSMVANGVGRDLAGYAEPYHAARYEGFAVWWLRDVGIEGNLYCGYAPGGFIGYWLAPRLRVAWNGSLNLPDAALRANLALRAASGTAETPDFLALLDAQGIDLFLGTGLPTPVRANRPIASTTAHLEGAPGWIPVFRSLRAAIYLRANARNAANLARIADAYARDGVPFDRERGFDPGAAIERARDWATQHGLVPIDYAALASARDSAERTPEPATKLDALARVELALGRYSAAAATDARLLELAPSHLPALRRRVCSLLHQGDASALAALPRAAAALASVSGGESPDPELVGAARAALRQGGLDRATRVRVPCFTREDEQRLAIGVRRPPARSRPDRNPSLRSEDPQSAASSFPKSKTKRSRICLAWARLAALSCIRVEIRTRTRARSRSKGPRSSAKSERSESTAELLSCRPKP
jgi:hypothetical protein